jgi:lysophospholipase L1-like esterase
MRKTLVSAALIVASTLISLGLAEGVLRMVLNAGDFLQIELLDDPVLGHRVEPLQGGHDALGFRNAGVPAQADIVALGDSQTYGVSAPRDESWPAQLGRLTGSTVYNMALGGYSPPDYLYLAQTLAPKLQPRRLVVGVYLGNDLIEACWAVQQRAHWARWRSSDGGDMCDVGHALDAGEPPKRFGALRDWLSRRSVLYGVLKATVFSTAGEREQKQAAAPAASDQRFPWADPAQPSVRTIFTPQARLAAMDLRLRGVREGLRITQLALDELAAQAARSHSTLLVILIPTKERVYCEHLQRTGAQMPPAFSALCAASDRVGAELTQHLAASGIAHVDVLAPLQAEVAKHVPLYPADTDGHPRGAGYAVIARAVAGALGSGAASP